MENAIQPYIGKFGCDEEITAYCDSFLEIPYYEDLVNWANSINVYNYIEPIGGDGIVGSIIDTRLYYTKVAFGDGTERYHYDGNNLSLGTSHTSLNDYDYYGYLMIYDKPNSVGWYKTYGGMKAAIFFGSAPIGGGIILPVPIPIPVG